MDVTIYRTALKFIGLDASPIDGAPDELGCAETVSNILIKAGCDLPVTLSTRELNRILKNSARWKLIPKNEAGIGDVIMAVTGEGGKNGVTNGHVGIIFPHGSIASNDSKTGTFIENYTYLSFQTRYEKKGGYPIYIYRRLGLTAPPPPTDEQKVEIAEEAIAVATEASKHPSLFAPVLALLKAILAFLGVDKLGAKLGISSKIKPTYLG